MKIKYPLEDPHTYSAEEIPGVFQTDIEAGLSEAEAGKRTKHFGPNAHRGQKQKSILRMILLQFKNPIVYLLLFAAAVTLYFQDFIEAIAIVAVILINALIGFLMELQARISMNALREMDVMQTKVLRAGKIREIPSDKLVPGDVVVLEAGELIAADARVVESIQLQCDESSLTGESLPVEKNTEKLPPKTPLADQLNMVFKGTSVTNGKGKAIVTGIANDTQLGKITTLVENPLEQETPLDKKISILGKTLIWITLGMTAVFATTGFLQGKDWVLILETSIALAVAAFPEGLPIVGTVALAHGMLLMARRNAIVKKLSAVETLGSTNVILTDKTGTLTENKIYVDTLAFPGETLKVSIHKTKLIFEEGTIELSEEAFEKLRLIAALCNNASPKDSRNKKKRLGDPIEIALIHFTDVSGIAAEKLKRQYPRMDEEPFSSDTKIMGTLHKSPDGHFIAAKGSVEHLLEKCTKIQVGNSIKNLSAGHKKEILADAEKMAADGLRVLGFAFGEHAGSGTKGFMHALVYVAMIGFLDPPRLDIRDAILSCRKAGIKIIMITGDHPMTALNIAKQVALVDEDEEHVISGTDLPPIKSLSAAWNKKIRETAVFARTTPTQKLEIVNSYQKAGNIVAMTGDGVNDAPALKQADIGIAMGKRGTQVAKETAGIVLKDDSFTSIALAVSHGRQIFQNIQKFVIYLVSCNLSEIFIVTALGFIAPASTLLPLQILLLNMVTDVFPALALGLGKGDESVMDQAPRKPKAPILSKRNWIDTFIYALTITGVVTAVVLYCRHSLGANDKIANNAAFITLAFAQLFHVFNMSSAGSPLFINDITKNKFVWIALLICSTFMLSLYLIPQLRGILNLDVFSAQVWGLSVLAALIPLLLIQLYKKIAHR